MGLDTKQEFTIFFHSDRTPIYGQLGQLYSPTGSVIGNTERHLQEANQKRYAVTTQCRRYIVQAGERNQIEQAMEEMRVKFEQEREEKLELLNEKLRNIEMAGEPLEDIPDIEDRLEPIEPLNLTDIEKETLAKLANLRNFKITRSLVTK